MKERDIPLHVFHFDCFWMKEFQWCDFEWDASSSRIPPRILRRLTDRGLKISVWINPYIAQKSRCSTKGWRTATWCDAPTGACGSGTGGRRAWGSWISPTRRHAVVPGAPRALLSAGVDCFKTDFGERIPIDVVYHDGSDPVRMHNYYPYLYNKAVFEVLGGNEGQGGGGGVCPLRHGGRPEVSGALGRG